MARPQIPTINWKTELSRLHRFLQKDGGVVHIRTLSDSPSSAFAKALRSRMEHTKWDTPWQTIQFDGNNAATHYFVDMLLQIERSVDIAYSPIGEAHPAVTIGSDIEAGRDVHIHDIVVNNVSDGARLHARAERIVTHLSTIHGERRVCLLFFDSDSADQRELSAFRSVLWDGKLEKLVQSGFLLIIFISHKAGTPHWMPDPDEVIDLPERYDDQTARNAIEDLAVHAMTQQWYASEEEARAFARTLVASNPKPRELYANFAAVQARMEQWQ